MSIQSGEFQIDYRFFATNLEVFDTDGSVARIKWGLVSPDAVGQIHGRNIELVHQHPHHYQIVVDTKTDSIVVAKVKPHLFTAPEISFINGDVYKWRRKSARVSNWLDESGNKTVEFSTAWYVLDCRASVHESIHPDVSGVLIAVGAYLRQVRVIRKVATIASASIIAFLFYLILSEL